MSGVVDMMHKVLGIAHWRFFIGRIDFGAPPLL